MEEEVRSPPQIKRGNVTWCFNELLEAYTHCITKNHTQSISTGEKNGIALLTYSLMHKICEIG